MIEKLAAASFCMFGHAIGDHYSAGQFRLKVIGGERAIRNGA
jgi:hypothetical protein